MLYPLSPSSLPALISLIFIEPGMDVSEKGSLLRCSRLRLISMILSCSSSTSLSSCVILRSFSAFSSLSLFIIFTLTNQMGISFRRSIVKSPILVCSMLRETTLLSIVIFLACRIRKSLVMWVLLPLPFFLIGSRRSSRQLREEYPSQMVWLVRCVFQRSLSRVLVVAKLLRLEVAAGEGVMQDPQACFWRAMELLAGCMRCATRESIFAWSSGCEKRLPACCGGAGLFVARESMIILQCARLSSRGSATSAAASAGDFLSTQGGTEGPVCRNTRGDGRGGPRA